MNLDTAITELEKLASNIRDLSLVDDKTTLGNTLALSKEIPIFNNSQSEFDTIIFGDINDFKKLNDTEGHQAGNFAIQKIGKMIDDKFVKNLKAKAFRQSGDEFVILLRQESIKEFQKIASDFKAVPFDYENKLLETKISFGVSVSDGKTSFNGLLERAETACLSAKTQGSGVCIVWNQEVERNKQVSIYFAT